MVLIFEKKSTNYFFWIGIATIVFFVAYGSCNYYASTVSHTYKLYFPWELKIPLVPWMIIPYRSLDWIFVVAYFLLDKVHTKRLALHMMISIIPAAIIFILFPGECGFVRPDPSTLGIWKPIYEVLYTLDKPHNLYPSLHITYSYLGLMAFHDMNKSLKVSLFSLVWFLMICASVILTYQHHVIDIVMGLGLGYLTYKYTFRLQPSPAYEMAT